MVSALNTSLYSAHPGLARQVPLSKDEALAAVQRSKVLKGLSIHGQVRDGSAVILSDVVW